MPGGPWSGRHEAGLSARSVYSQFISREEIVTAIADAVTQEITSFLDQFCAAGRVSLA
jgi:AcrR family transcriptional regulator